MKLRLTLSVWLVVLALGAVGMGREQLAASETHRAYVSLVVGERWPGKGLALSADWACSDLSAVGSRWYYTWAETLPYCGGQTTAQWIPLALDGKPHSCYETVMFYNEPTISPAQAASDVNEYRADCPASFVVLGNVEQTQLSWAQDTLALLPNFAGAVGFHAYCWQTADGCTVVFAEFAAGLPGRELWVTEMAVFLAYDDPAQVTWLVNECRAIAKRCAWYPHRCTTGDPFCEPTDRQAALFDGAGSLTPAGAAYRDFAPPAGGLTP